MGDEQKPVGNIIAPHGVGSALHADLAAWGFKERDGCRCQEYAMRMNQRGPQWCKNNVAKICGWLRESAKSRRLPFSRLVARRFVGKAIDKYIAEVGDIRNTFSRIFCVNLDRRNDRWQQFAGKVPNSWPFSPIYRWSAVDGRKISPPDWWKQGAGAWGCYRSHLNIIEYALNQRIRSLLILEDDARFDTDFASRARSYLASLPKDWEMAYLGGQHLKPFKRPPERVNEHVLRPFNVNRTHAYAVRGRKMFQKLYHHLNDVRNWRNSHHIDHHYGRLIERREGGIYTPEKWLIGQAAGHSNIRGAQVNESWWPPERILEHETPMVAVVGPFRGGTSCVAGALHKMGVSMGHTFAPPKPANPRGFFEAQVLARICRQSVKEPQMEKQRSHAWRVRELRNWAYNRRLSVSTIHGGKHPSMCLLVPELLNAWRNVRFIRVVRPEEESIQSIKKRSWGWPDGLAEKVIPRMIQQRDADLEQVEPAHVATVKYHELITDPEAVLSGLLDFLEYEPADVQMKAAIEFVDPSLRTVTA